MIFGVCNMWIHILICLMIVKFKFLILTVTSHLVHVKNRELVPYFLQVRVKQVW